MDQINSFDLIVVGAGFYGLTIAERFATAGRSVAVIDRRDVVGGNAYSYPDPQTGIEVHKYGCHIFHTSNQDIWEYVNRFGDWVPYEHRVWTEHRGQVFSMPVNLHTMSQFFGRRLTPTAAYELVLQQAGDEVSLSKETFEGRAVHAIGRPLYEAFFRGYTEKQWQTDPAELPGEVFSRLPVRFNFDNRYFNDTFQALPRLGYGELLRSMASIPGITVYLNTDWRDIRDDVDPKQLVVYSGALDEFFNGVAGQLPWRTLDFDFEVCSVPDYQGVPQLNFADPEVPYTRIHEFVHYPPHQRFDMSRTVIAREYSRFAEFGDDVYYPIHTPATREQVDMYRRLIRDQRSRVWFGGRLGSYKYLDMHMAIGSALLDARKLLENRAP